MRCSADRQHERNPGWGVRTTHGGWPLVLLAFITCSFIACSPVLELPKGGTGLVQAGMLNGFG